jgi:hypothetical protein
MANGKRIKLQDLKDLLADYKIEFDKVTYFYSETYQRIEQVYLEFET